MDISEAIVSLWITISNWFWVLIRKIWEIFSGLLEILSFLGSLIETLVYWIGSLLSWVVRLVNQIFTNGVFSSVWQAFWQIADYIWGPATVIMASLFLLAIVRIGIAFVFKLLRLNIDYHALNSKSKTYNQHDSLK